MNFQNTFPAMKERFIKKIKQIFTSFYLWYKGIDWSIKFFTYVVIGHLILLTLWFCFDSPICWKTEILENVRIEYIGFGLDLILLGLIQSILYQRHQRKQDIKRWKEEIDDFRGWNEKEAMYRIVGLIRRLSAAKEHALDLSHCYLRYATLKGINLSGSNLSDAKLDGAELDGAILNDCNFERASLQGANLADAKLKRSNLQNSILLTLVYSNEDPVFYKSLISPNLPSFKRTNLEGANLESARLENAHLYGANLKNTSFNEAKLDGANLQGSILDGAKFMNASLAGVAVDKEWYDSVRFNQTKGGEYIFENYTYSEGKLWPYSERHD